MVGRSVFPFNNVAMQNDICIGFGNQLKRLRAKNQLPQEELAHRAGISTKYLQNLEGKNPKKASIVTIEKLAKAFKITPSDLLKFK